MRTSWLSRTEVGAISNTRRRVFLAPLLGAALLFLLIPGCISTYNTKDPEHLAKTVTNILRKQDAAGLKHVIPSKEDLESFLATADMPEEEAKEMRGEMAELLGDFEAANTRSYQQAIDAVSREGGLIRKLHISDIHTTNRESLDNPMADIVVDLLLDDQPYTLTIPGAGKMPRGWVLGLDGFSLDKAKDK